MPRFSSMVSRVPRGVGRRVAAERQPLVAERLEGRSMLAPVVAGLVASVPDLAAQSDTGWSSSDNKTSINTPVFSGFAAPGAVGVNLYDGKRLLGTAPVDAGLGQWVFTSPVLANGKHSIAAQAVDASGGVGKTSKPLAVEIGSAVPAGTTFALDAKSDSGIKKDDRTNVAAPRISGRAAAGTAVMVWVDGTSMGTAMVGRTGGWSHQLPTLSEGAHTVAVAVGNVFGLQSGFSTRTIVIDTVRPTATLTYVPEASSVVAVFSRPVVGVSLKGMRILGSTESGLSFDVPLTDSNVRSRVGSITIARSADFTTYTLRMQRPLTQPGAYTLTLKAATSGIVDAFAGNPLLEDATVTVLI